MRLTGHEADGLLEDRLRVRPVGQDVPLVSDDPLPLVVLLDSRVVHGPFGVPGALQVHGRGRLRRLRWLHHGTLRRLARATMLRFGPAAFAAVSFSPSIVPQSDRVRRASLGSAMAYPEATIRTCCWAGSHCGI